METRTIECVAFFYHEGAKGDDFIQKISFDAASIPVSGEVGWSYASTFRKFIFGLYMNWYKLCSSKLFQLVCFSWSLI